MSLGLVLIANSCDENGLWFYTFWFCTIESESGFNLHAPLKKEGRWVIWGLLWLKRIESESNNVLNSLCESQVSCLTLQVNVGQHSLSMWGPGVLMVGRKILKRQLERTQSCRDKVNCWTKWNVELPLLSFVCEARGPNDAMQCYKEM